MFRRLSVLPLFFIIFILILFSCDLVFGKVRGSSSGFGSATVPVTSTGVGLRRNGSRQYDHERFNYDQSRYQRVQSVKGNVSGENFFGGHPSRRSVSDSRRSSRYSTSDSFMSRSGYRGLSAGAGGVDNGLSNLSNSGELFGSDDDKLMLSLLNTKLDSLGDTRSSPVVSQQLQPRISEDLARRVDRLAGREKRIEGRLMFESKVYLRQENSFSRKVESDVNIYPEGESEYALVELRMPDEYDKIDNPLSPDEVREEIAKLLDTDRQEQKKNTKAEDLESYAEKTEDPESDQADGSQGDAFAEYAYVNVDSKQSKELLAEFADFTNYTNEKYQSYIKTADKLLKKGEYYNAKDAYEIAGAWKNGHWRALMGRAYAHFAAGEYVSSSTCIVRAIESSGEYSDTKVDIADLIGNKELYKKHLVEVEALYEASGYYKVAFLLAYLYYENGDLDKAKGCIDSAEAVLAQSNAWKSLRDAISNKLLVISN